jgi:hypothetical protein
VGFIFINFSIVFNADAERGLKRTAEDADAAPKDGSKKSKKKKKKTDKTRQQDDEIANDKANDGRMCYDIVVPFS